MQNSHTAKNLRITLARALAQQTITRTEGHSLRILGSCAVQTEHLKSVHLVAVGLLCGLQVVLGVPPPTPHKNQNLRKAVFLWQLPQRKLRKAVSYRTCSF